MKCRVLSLLVLLLWSSSPLFSQTLSVGVSKSLEDAFRRQQLMGNDESNSSYMVRPLFLSEDNDVELDLNTGLRLKDFYKEIYSNSKLKSSVYLLPVALQQQVNTHHPFGINDGSMIQARGYQMQFSGGIFAKIGPLSIQFRPELVYAENKRFTTLQESNTGGEYKNSDFIFQNKIDNPERFGLSPYSRANWGQSSIRLTFDPVSFGFSTENLWWGPGVKNALLMTNNATGFRHFTLNTTRPVDIYIGHIESQIIGGRLSRSGLPIDGTNEFIHYPDKPQDWRYISGIVFTYQPKWVPNFYLGFDRSFVVYREDMGRKFADYFPILGSVEKSSANDAAGGDDDTKRRDQYISFFARYVLPESKAEAYFQFGKNDHSYNGRDALTKLDHTRAYVAGFRKLIPLKNEDEFIQFETELTQMAKPSSEDKNRNGQSWYAHYQVRDGYTNLGRVLGAGIGPGSNMQSFDVAWVKGLKSIGIGGVRIDQNNDRYYESKTTDTRRHWVDLGGKATFNWDFGKFIVSSEATYIHSFNYQYGLIQEPDAFAWDWDHQDANNFNFRVGLMYRW